MRRTRLPLVLLLAATVLLVGCTEMQEGALTDDGNDDLCLTCHGDQDVLMAMLPEGRAATTTRSDG